MKFLSVQKIWFFFYGLYRAISPYSSCWIYFPPKVSTLHKAEVSPCKQEKDGNELSEREREREWGRVYCEDRRCGRRNWKILISHVDHGVNLGGHLLTLNSRRLLEEGKGPKTVIFNFKCQSQLLWWNSPRAAVPRLQFLIDSGTRPLILYIYWKAHILTSGFRGCLVETVEVPVKKKQ